MSKFPESVVQIENVPVVMATEALDGAQTQASTERDLDTAQVKTTKPYSAAETVVQLQSPRNRAELIMKVRALKAQRRARRQARVSSMLLSGAVAHLRAASIYED